ncbi:BnaA02g17170D [Brassica napus]|uniref:BnaA02g17170D protein n=1 Tax=Brassica napus TaxID=3708 RepID=A0A078I9D3_BRANA|nr:BnaA02g17170D [Brassica napus]
MLKLSLDITSSDECFDLIAGFIEHGDCTVLMMRTLRDVIILLIFLSTAFMFLIYFAPPFALALRLLSVHQSRKSTSFIFVKRNAREAKSLQPKLVFQRYQTRRNQRQRPIITLAVRLVAAGLMLKLKQTQADNEGQENFEWLPLVAALMKLTGLSSMKDGQRGLYAMFKS